MKQSLIFFIIFSIFISCKDEKQNVGKIDDDFKIFVEKFSRDSLFQISRIDFPLTVTELDDEYESVEKKIKQNEYMKIDLRYNDSLANRQSDNYTQKLKLTKEKATIEIRGIDNGIMMDVYFEKRNEKWKLIGWDDSST